MTRSGVTGFIYISAYRQSMVCLHGNDLEGRRAQRGFHHPGSRSFEHPHREPMCVQLGARFVTGPATTATPVAPRVRYPQPRTRRRIGGHRTRSMSA